jgi:transposase
MQKKNALKRGSAGHDVRLIAARFVKPFVKSNKNDFLGYGSHR